MNKYDERTPAEKERDERITWLEGDLSRLAVCHTRLMARVEILSGRVSEEVARQAVELAGEIADQFAAARAGELGELTARVAKLEQRQDEMDVLPVEDGDDAASEDTDDLVMWPPPYHDTWPSKQPARPDGYEDPGPQSVSPLG